MRSTRLAEEPARHPGQDAAIRKSECLLAEIESAIERTRQVTIEVDGLGQIWLDPEHSLYWQQVTDPDAFFSTPSSQASVTRASAPNMRLPSGPLEELLWDAAFLGSGGRLFEGSSLHDLLELNWWPNLTRIAHYESTFALCAFLSNRPSTMHLAFRALHLSEDEACRFYNGGRASGCLKLLKTRSGEPASLKAVMKSDKEGAGDRAALPFWSRLFNRISGL